MIRDRLTRLAMRASEIAERTSDKILDLNVFSSFGRTGFVLRSRNFEESDLEVDMTGRQCLVTGANSGIGFATCLGLAKRGATVHMLCRNQERAQAAQAELIEATQNLNIHIHIVDIAKQESIRQFVRDFEPTEIDVLVNNAGVLTDERQLTEDGVELTCATNLLGPILLASLLAPKLESGRPGRIINVSSGGMYLTRLSISELTEREGRFDGVKAYANTKRAMVAVTGHMAELWRERNLVLSAMHPGWADTPAVRSSLPRFYKYTQAILRDRDQGADTVVWLAVAEAPGHQSGLFWFDREPRTPHLLPWTRESKGAREELWQIASQLVGLAPETGEPV